VLEYLIREHRAQRIAEVGVDRCRTMRQILRSECRHLIQEYWAIDCWMNGRIKTELVDPVETQGDVRYRMACSYMPVFPQLRVVRLTSAEASGLFAGRFDTTGYFDLVFIDADHAYESVVDDIRCWRRLVRRGGVLCGHDYYGDGARHPGVKRAVDKVLGPVEVLPRTVWVTRP
jgi:hypothetical protein